MNAHTQSHAAYRTSPPPTTRLPSLPISLIASRCVIMTQTALEHNIRSRREFVLCSQTLQILCLLIWIMTLRSGTVVDVLESVPEFLD